MKYLFFLICFFFIDHTYNIFVFSGLITFFFLGFGSEGSGEKMKKEKEKQRKKIKGKWWELVLTTSVEEAVKRKRKRKRKRWNLEKEMRDGMEYIIIIFKYSISNIENHVYTIKIWFR